jgi:hypothetical protein
MRLRYLGGAIAPDNQPLSNADTATGVAAQYQGSFSRQDVAQAETRGLWIADPHPADQATVMNINSDNAANALQNNTFIDGAQNLPVTRVGSVTQGSFSPFTNPARTWSAYFGGVGNYITANTNAFAVSQTTFTVECWMCMTETPGANPTIIGDMQPAAGGNNWGFGPNSSYKLMFYWYDGSPKSAVGTTILRLHTWYHIAVSVNANAISLFVNGVPEVMTGTTTLTSRAATNTIALGQAQTSSQIFTGYATNVSILSGTAKYAAGTTFNPPTDPLPTNTTNQVFLLGGNNIMADDNTATTAKVLTFTGAVAVSTFSPFYTPYSYKNNTFGGSMAFSGTGQYLTLGGQSQFAFGTSDFTIEFFVFYTSIAANSFIYDSRPNGVLSGLYPTIYNDVAARTFVFYTNTAARITSNAGVLNAGVWTHVAVSRVSGTTRMFINGTLQTATYADTNSYLNGASRPIICADGNATGGTAVAGNVSNLRVINGTGLYTTSFTIPLQPLQAITNTQLLTCQGGTVDTSANAFTITNTGPATVSTSGPFTTFVNQTFRSWPAGSIYCDGTASYLNLNGSSTLAFGSNNFSIAMWVYFNGSLGAANQILYDGRASGGTATLAPALYVAQTTSVLSYFTNNAVRITGTTVIKPGQWYYVDLSRVSGSTRLYLNGVQEGATYTDANVYINGASRPVIGAGGDTAGAGPLSGFIYGLQVRNGSSSAGSFPSTYPNFSPNTLANTVLYLSGVNAGIYDTVGFTDYQTLGNAQVSTNTVKYGSGSVFFDGTGDWLISTATTNNANQANLQLGQGDFTIEAWVNVSTLAAVRSIISKGAAATGWTVNISTAGKLQFAQTSTTYTGIGTIVINQWYHIAVVRSGTGANNLRMYLNGIIDFESAAAVTTNFNQTELIYVGADRAGTTPMLGYIADLRVTKYARYLQNFVPPQATLPKH